MHHALEIQEILLNVFVHCRPSLPSRRRATPDLLALATTCRAFKELALDVLWGELDNLSPLVRCLPEASCALFRTENEGEDSLNPFTADKYYSFSRTPTQAEWVTLRGYTRRIRSIVEDFQSSLDKAAFQTLSDPSTISESLFPNLRYLRCEYTTEAAPLLRLPFPSLTSLDLVFGDTSIFLDYLESFPVLSSNVRMVSVRVRRLEDMFIKIEPSYICQWQNLQVVIFPQIDLETEVLAHLSCMHALTRLVFKLSAILPASDSPLLFTHLHDLTLHSGSLYAVSRLLSLVRLPTITEFTVIVSSCPSREELSTFLAGVQTSSTAHTIRRLTLDQPAPSMSGTRSREAPSLCMEDLRPCMVFSDLRCMKLNIEWNVGLTDRELLTLATSWPHLEHLVINAYSGWNTPGGLTPNGLIQLLQTCRSLCWIALAIDTRGYIESSPCGSQAILGLALPPTVCINVVDSVIEAESVLAIAAFFGAIMPCSNFSFSAWRGGKMVKPEGWEAYKARWDNVFRWANRQSAFLHHHMELQR